MPIPSPHEDESADDFHSRCMSAIWDEYGDKPSQANEICFSAWREHKKMIDTGTGLIAYDLQGQRKKEASMNGGPKRLYGRIEKVEDVGDGTIKVHGIASTETEDDQGEIVRGDAMRAAIPDYMRFGAVREMHGLSAAGRALECNCGNDNVTRIVAHVVDPTAVLKVKNRVYNGFSIGGRVDEREAGNYKTISKLTLHEISLVDRPANPQAMIDLWKAAVGDTQMSTDDLGVMKSAFAEALARTQQFWRCNYSSHMHTKKDDAANCMAKNAAADAMKSKTKMPKDDRRFGDGNDDEPDADPDDTAKHGLPNTPPIKPGEPPGGENSETNFDGDADADDRAPSFDSAGGGFKPESEADRASDFGKKGIDDPKKPYGDVPYADPGYQSDKKKRYALDTKKRVRAAWSYINQADNARLYTSEQLGRVKARIRSYAKKYGIEISEKAAFDLGDPDALLQALATYAVDELVDGLPYDVDMVIEKAGRRQSGADGFLKNVVHDAIGKLTDGQFCMKASGNAAQDTAGNAEHPAPTENTDSGTAHFTGGNSAQDTASKRGARHNAMTLKYLKKAHDNICDAGASCPGREFHKSSTAEESAMSANPTNTSDEGSDATTMALAKALKNNKKLKKAVEAMNQNMRDMQLRMEYMAKEAGKEPPPPPPQVALPEKEPKLKKQMTALVETLGAVQQRVEQIASTPIPASASHLPAGIIDVSKTQDGRQGGGPPPQQVAVAEQYAKAWSEMSDDDKFAAAYHVAKMRPYIPPR